MMGEEGKSDNFDLYLRFSLPHRNRYTNFRGKNLGGREYVLTLKDKDPDTQASYLLPGSECAD